MMLVQRAQPRAPPPPVHGSAGWPSTLLNLTSWSFLLQIFEEFLKITKEKIVFPEFCKLASPFSPTLPTCLYPFWKPLYPLWKPCSTNFLFSPSSPLGEKKTTIRTYKWIFFKCETMVYWRLGENNILSTFRTELNKMGGEHSKD